MPKNLGRYTNDLSVPRKEDVDAKQNKLTFDSTPTKDSGNPVTSGGVWAAIDALTASDVGTIEITTPTKSDAGKFLRVNTNGNAEWQTVPSANGVSF